MKNKLFYAIAAAMATGVQAEESTLPTIQVEAEQIVDANTSELTIDTLIRPTPSDGGEWILEVPGVSGVRMGTHGIDPVIRGQKNNQLNILLGGAYIFGGCPNRMDPPSSYATPEIYDSALVIKGMQSLIYGAGGPGGTVLYERATPEFEAGENFYGKAGAGYESNGAIWNAFADAAAGSNKAFLRGTISAAEQTENYTDGEGNEVHSGYKTNAGNLLIGGRTDGGTLVRFDLDAHFLAAREARSMITGERIPIAGSLYLNAKLAYRIMDEPRLEIFGLATNISDTKFGEGITAEIADHGASRVGRRFLLGLGAEL